MTLDDRLKFCKICENRQMNPSIGLVCGLTGAKPAFEVTCPDVKIDQKEADRLIQQEKAVAMSEEESGGFLAPEKKGIRKGAMGGIIMIVIAVVWFFVGLAADRIFFYPPILLIIGIYALVKGLASGNFTGEKN